MPNQRLRAQSELPEAAQKSVPISAAESELAARIQDAIGDEPVAAFGRRSGISESLLRKYLVGAVPSLLKAAAIASAANVSIEWLATGRGSRKRVPSQPADLGDLDRLTRTVAAVEEGLRSVKLTLPPDKYAELVAAAYQLMGAATSTSAQIVQFIRASRA